MAGKRSLTLGVVQETLLIPLYARAVESAKRRPILRDPAAVRLVEAIDYDFSRFGKNTSVMSTYFALRTAIFDEWVRGFLGRHPTGTVVEIGAGLSTRYERLDNGRAWWVDIDLPDAAEVRRTFFPDTPRRRTVSSSILDELWIAPVAASPGPYLFVAEGVLVYLREPDVRLALTMITNNFSGSWLALDTYGSRIIREQGRYGPLAATRALLAWACDNPRDIEKWGLCLRLIGSRALTEPQPAVRRLLSPLVRAMLALIRLLSPRWMNKTRVNLFHHQPG